MTSKTNLKALSADEIKHLVNDNGLPSFRANQIMHWIYEKYACSIDEITEFSKPLREQMSRLAYISNLKIATHQVSSDGTEKFLFTLEDNKAIESVLIPDKDRLTLCISSQVGCAMGCAFCLTGKSGFERNLKAHEIVDQIININRIIMPRKITNIVLMGMGEPLANIDEVSEALHRITKLLKISKRRITLSTSGIVPAIERLPKIAPDINLAISLNAPTDEIRNKIMPINRKYTIEQLIGICRQYPLKPRRRITFEYVLISGLNDSLNDAKKVVKLLRGIPCKVNLIPFNPYPGTDLKRPEDDKILAFQKVIAESNLTVFIRESRGRDISAACGQLKGIRAQRTSP